MHPTLLKRGLNGGNEVENCPSKHGGSTKRPKLEGGLPKPADPWGPGTDKKDRAA